MDLLQHLAGGFLISFEWLNLGLMVLGCGLGLAIGATPGMGSVNGVAVLLPITFFVPPTTAIIFLCAIYYGAMYGGAISSILLGIPGASTAVATTFDGRPLAMAGRADLALTAAAVASFVGGTVSIILFTLIAPPLAEIALQFGPHEEFALMLLAFSTFLGLGGDDPFKTLLAILFGLILATVGLDIISGQPRLIFFDLPGLYKGISFIVLAIGIYGIGEMLWTMQMSGGKTRVSDYRLSISRFFAALREIALSWRVTVLSSVLGFFVGILPAAGATPASLMSYGMAKTLSKDPDRYGKGVVDGVVAPESANNSASTGALLPMFTLGIPGSPTTAILLGGMVIWGLTPGPLLFTQEPELVWGLTASLYSANIVTLILNLALIPLFVRILRMPFSIMAPIIFVLCFVGGFAPAQRMFDPWLILLFGVLGYGMRCLNYPLAPLVLAIVLGPLAEKSFRQSLIGSQGDVVAFIYRPGSESFTLGGVPISGLILLGAVFMLSYPIFARFSRKRRALRAE